MRTTKIVLLSYRYFKMKPYNTNLRIDAKELADDAKELAKRRHMSFNGFVVSLIEKEVQKEKTLNNKINE